MTDGAMLAEILEALEIPCDKFSFHGKLDALAAGLGISTEGRLLGDVLDDIAAKEGIQRDNRLYGAFIRKLYDYVTNGEDVTLTGNPLVLANSMGRPLKECVVSWEPTQEGEGTPSPDNIRPTHGRDSIRIERCGENLLNIAPFTKLTKQGITYEYVANGGVHISGTATANVDSPTFAVGFLPPGKYYGLDMGTGIVASIVVQRKGSNGYLWLNAKGVFEIQAGDVIKYWYMIANNGVTLDKTVYPYIVPGTSAPATHSPYTGSTTTLTLPSIIYGGEVNAVTGEGQETWMLLTLTGEEQSHIYTTLFYLDLNAPGAYDFITGTCSHYKYITYSDGAIGVTRGDNDAAVVYSPPHGAYEISEAGLAAWKAYLAAQYAAGRPVQLAYKLATPIPFQSTGGGTIPTVKGTNTLLTDADTIKATYRCNVHAAEQELDTLYTDLLQELEE